MPKSEEVLNEIRLLKSWLYGSNGKEGDIPEIKQSLKGFAKRLNGQDKKITANRIIIAAILGSGVLGGGTAALIQLLQ